MKITIRKHYSKEGVYPRRTSIAFHQQTAACLAAETVQAIDEQEDI